MASTFNNIRFSGNDSVDAVGTNIYLYREKTPTTIPTNFSATDAKAATYEGSAIIASFRDMNSYNYSFNANETSNLGSNQTYLVVNNSGNVINFTSVDNSGTTIGLNNYSADAANGNPSPNLLVRQTDPAALL